jgi:general secretion pathway protein C
MIIAAMQRLPFSSGTNLWSIRLLTFLLAGMAAGSALYWVLKWPTSGPAVRDVTLAPATTVIDTEKIAQLLGASHGPAQASEAADVGAANFKLVGVIAQGSHGSALIAVDGKPAKPFRVGSEVGNGLFLRAVSSRTAQLATALNAPASVTLELPKPAQP